jgi:hypothetical protein
VQAPCRVNPWVYCRSLTHFALCSFRPQDYTYVTFSPVVRALLATPVVALTLLLLIYSTARRYYAGGAPEGQNGCPSVTPCESLIHPPTQRDPLDLPITYPTPCFLGSRISGPVKERCRADRRIPRPHIPR